MCRLAWLNRLSPSFILAVRLAEAPSRMCPIFENSSGALYGWNERQIAMIFMAEERTRFAGGARTKGEATI